MTNFKNDKFYKITNAKQTIPASANGTGTVSTSGIFVTGTSTLFVSEMSKGSWITDLTNNEIREVDEVLSDTSAKLKQAFTADLSSVTPNIIAKRDLDIRELSVIIPLVNAAGTAYAFGEIDGVELESGLPLTFGKASKDTKDTFSYIDPIIADATGTVMNVTILK